MPYSMRSLQWKALKMGRAFLHKQKTQRLKMDVCPKCGKPSLKVKIEEVDKNLHAKAGTIHCLTCGANDEFVMVGNAWEETDFVDFFGDRFRHAIAEANAQKLEAEIPATF